MLFPHSRPLVNPLQAFRLLPSALLSLPPALTGLPTLLAASDLTALTSRVPSSASLTRSAGRASPLQLHSPRVRPATLKAG